MGRLAGFKYREIVRRLKRMGFPFDRQAAGSHEIWFNPLTNRYTTIPNHPAICPKVLCAPSCRKLGSRRASSWRSDPFPLFPHAHWQSPVLETAVRRVPLTATISDYDGSRVIFA